MPRTTTSPIQPQCELSWQDGLAWLVAPMPLDVFLHDHWRGQRAVHIRAAASKIEGFYSLAAHHDAIPRIRPSHVRAAYDDGSPEQPGLGLEQALEHFGRGATICVTTLNSADAVLSELCTILNRQLVSPDRFYVNSYYSPAGQGFGIHYDPQSVWIVQIEGRKRWRYSRTPEVEYPLQGTTGVLHAAGGGRVPEPGELACADLAPGDVLYLPPGTWHRGEALGGPSFALSLSQPHDGVLPILTRVLATRFQSVDWHRHFPAAVDGAPAIDAHLLGALGELHSITLDELRDAWSTLAIAGTPKPLLTFDRGDDVLFYAGGRRYTLPPICRTLFDAMRERALTRAEALALLGDDEALLADLVQIGAWPQEVE
jgi:hypothetical protein